MLTTPLTPVKPNLTRYVDAQMGIFDSALAELKRGKKTGHWMWFIFPQIKGLGSSATSEYFGIHGREEAEDYLSDPILGKRLIECANTLLKSQWEGQPEIRKPILRRYFMRSCLSSENSCII